MPFCTPTTGVGAYQGCCYCCEQGEYSKVLSKMVYLGHRKFLKRDDPLHKDKNFPHPTDPSSPPALKTMEFVDGANARHAAATTAKDKKLIERETGCKGSYSLRRLPGHDSFLSIPPDPMHLLKNIAEHVVRVISGPEDSVKVRMEEEKRDRFQSSWVEYASTPARGRLPPAPFRLQSEDLAVANKRAMSVKVPFGFDWMRRPVFQTKSTGMKSHEWKQLISTGILKYCIRGLLGKRQRATVFELCDVVAQLCAEVIDVHELDALEVRVHRVLALLERDFPVSLHVIVFHLLHHLPTFLKRFLWSSARVLDVPHGAIQFVDDTPSPKPSLSGIHYNRDISCV